MEISQDVLVNSIGEGLRRLRAGMEANSGDLAERTFSRLDALGTAVASVKTATVGLHRLVVDQRRRRPEPPAADIVLRGLVVQVLAAARKTTNLDAVADAAFPGRDDVKLAARDPASFWLARTATAPAQTGVAGWAAELVGSSVGPVASLMPASAFSRLAAAARIRLDFDRGGAISLPGRIASVLPGGGFVGEGSPIPTRQMNFASGVSASPYPAKAITVLSRELAQRGVANVTAILADALAEDLELSIDSVLVSNQAGTSLHPPGLLFGVVAIPTPAASDLTSTLALVLADLVGAISPASDPVFIASPADVAAIAVLAPGVAASFIASAQVPAGTIIAVDAASMFFGEDASAFSVETTEEAVLHSEDTAAAPIVGDQSPPPALADVATPVRSLWQSACVAVRTIGEVSWGMRRPNAVSYIESWRGA